MSRDIVLLSTADWDNPFWTNKQHVAVHLAERGFRVLYIDSLGLRRPAANGADVARMARRLRLALAGPRRVHDNIHVWSPVVLPFHQRATVRAINRAALSAALGAVTRRLGFRDPMLWTYNPLTTRLFDVRRFGRLVYHCVDDVAAQPGMPSVVLEAAERELARSASVVFATAPRLAERQAKTNPNTHFLPNVADFDHFARALDATLAVPADLAAIPAPRIGFVGAISGYKLDFGLIRRIAEQRPDWSVVLIGRVGEGDPWTDCSIFEGLPNLHLLGPRPYDVLPAYLKGFDVAMLPNAINDYTASMFPMKFFEYLAAGRPVVSVDLPAIRAYHDAVAIATSPAEFVTAIDAMIRGKGPPLEERLALARAHTWAARTDRMIALLDPDASALATNANGRASAANGNGSANTANAADAA
jgi:glycosyltransferase involved in cell wall biosynthesis